MEGDDEAPITAIRQYNWKGVHIGYFCQERSIPEGNDEFRRVRDGIASGTHREIEPKIESASQVFDSRGRLTGFDTNIGFVPNDPENRLLQLLDQTIKSGTCRVREPEAVANCFSGTDAVIVCVIFDRPWPNLGGTFERIFPYRSAADCTPRDLLVKLWNAPEEGDAAWNMNLIFKQFGVQMNLPGPIGSPVQVAVLEIDIPIRDVSRLFRTEHRRLEPWIRAVVEDNLDEHYVRTGRSHSSGPTIEWLVLRTSWWLGRLVTALSNTVIRTYIREWGGNPPGYVKEDVLARHAVILARNRNSKYHLCGIGNSGGGRLNLKGSWQDGAATLEMNPEINPGGHKKQVLWRIRQMTDAGFGVEALALLSSYLEVTLRDALILAIGPSPKNYELVKKIGKLGHRRRLELLGRLVQAKLDTVLSFPSVASLILVISRIYDHRNDYLHDLELPQGEAWLSMETERQIGEWITLFAEYGTPPSWSVILSRLLHANNQVQEFLQNIIAAIPLEDEDPA